MSLTSFLKNNDVKDKFSLEFQMPEFKLTGELIAPPMTRHYTLVGTAFDYLMRFYLKNNNPDAITQGWVAENALDLIEDRALLKKITNTIAEAKSNYAEYLNGGKMSDKVIMSCLLLAQIDPIYRALVIDPNMGSLDSGDVEDMKNLIRLVDPKIFTSKQLCMLNPTFGEASSLVGGADMDLLLDNTLIDIKTTKFLNLDREHYNQIIGYYFLYLIGGIDNAPKNTNIDYIGIYFSRHGLLFRTPVKEALGGCDRKEFIKWLKRRANQEYLA